MNEYVYACERVCACVRACAHVRAYVICDTYVVNTSIHVLYGMLLFTWAL